MWRQEAIDDRVYLSGRDVGRLVEQVREAGGEEKKERNGGEEQVEGNAARQKKNVVFSAIVPDALARNRAASSRSWHGAAALPLALFIRGLRLGDALLKLDSRLLRRSTAGIDGIRDLPALELDRIPAESMRFSTSVLARAGECCPQSR